MNYAFLASKVSPEWGYPVALARALSPDIGTEIGNCIYYSDQYGDYCCEITNKNEIQYQLVACGWVDKDKCRLTEEK